jgi:hypothetical protein
MARRHPVAGVVGEQDVRVGGQCRGEHVAVLGVHVDLVDGVEVLRGDLDEGVLGVGRRSAPTVLTATWSMPYERASTTPMMVLNAESRRFGRSRVDRR